MMQEELNTHYEYHCKAEAVYVDTLLKKSFRIIKRKMDSSLVSGQATKYHTDLCDRRLVERRESFHVQKSDTTCSDVGTCTYCLCKQRCSTEEQRNSNGKSGGS